MVSLLLEVVDMEMVGEMVLIKVVNQVMDGER